MERGSGVCSSSFSHQVKRIHSNSSSRFEAGVNDAGLAFERVYESRDMPETRNDIDPLRVEESDSESPSRVCDLDRHLARVHSHLSLDLDGLDPDNSDSHIHAHLDQNLCPDPNLHYTVDFSRTVRVRECLGVQYSDSVRIVPHDSARQFCVVYLYELLRTPVPSLE